jgi:hypothetical protein
MPAVAPAMNRADGAAALASAMFLKTYSTARASAVARYESTITTTALEFRFMSNPFRGKVLGSECLISSPQSLPYQFSTRL